MRCYTRSQPWAESKILAGGIVDAEYARPQLGVKATMERITNCQAQGDGLRPDFTRTVEFWPVGSANGISTRHVLDIAQLAAA